MDCHSWLARFRCLGGSDDSFNVGFCAAQRKDCRQTVGEEVRALKREARGYGADRTDPGRDVLTRVGAIDWAIWVDGYGLAAWPAVKPAVMLLGWRFDAILRSGDERGLINCWGESLVPNRRRTDRDGRLRPGRQGFGAAVVRAQLNRAGDNAASWAGGVEVVLAVWTRDGLPR